MVARLVDRYVRAFDPERVVVFGSFAKGTAHERSDVDMLVVADLPGDPALHLRRARQLAADCFPPVDVVLCAPEDLGRAEQAETAFFLSAVETGLAVYVRPER